MNNNRRKKVRLILERLESLKDDLTEVLEDEEWAFGNLPESFQEGDKGAKMQEGIEAIEGAIQDIEGVVEQLNNAIE